VLFAGGFAAFHAGSGFAARLSGPVRVGLLPGGVIVTVFMAGLALGAFVMNRLSHCGPGSLSLLALAIAGYAVLLPLLLPLLSRMEVPRRRSRW